MRPTASARLEGAVASDRVRAGSARVRSQVGSGTPHASQNRVSLSAIVSPEPGSAVPATHWSRLGPAAGGNEFPMK